MEGNNQNITENNPLVSIIVITYNSAKYVLETLESAKAQTYKNIELIVSDDASTDNTVEICRTWLEKNKDRFVRVELITSKKNTGIAPNCNRGLYAAKGEWIKYIAGDDLLEIKSIYDNIKYINNKKEAKVVFSNCKVFGFENLNNLEYDTRFYELSAFYQYNYLLKKNPCITVTAFINKDILYEVNCFDNSYPMIEDYPLWLKFTRQGIKLYGFNRITVSYRRGHNNIQSTKNQAYILYQKNLIKLYLFEILIELLKQNQFKDMSTKIKLVLNFYFWIYPRQIVKKIIIFIRSSLVTMVE